MKHAVIVVATVVALSAAVAVHGQALSMSRFSSSGLVFPGPPNGQSRQSDTSAQLTRRSAQGAQPVRVRPQQQQKLPAVPLSMIGQQPEEFIAAAQQRQLQQQQQQQQEEEQRAQQQQQAIASKQGDTEEDEEEFTSAEEEFLPRPAPVRPLQRQDIQRPAGAPSRAQQQRDEPERPARPQQQQQQQREEASRIRPRPVQEVERPEPSIQQAVQQRRPNYPANYKPRPQEVNDVEEERRRPNESDADLVDEEEEQVKPDKLQILLQKTTFSCATRKDGYYADEEVDCEVFHYCQDRTRHSWLCPEGAIFHQVHLICMPISKENICKKSSQFHFVNDYLYKPLQDEDGNNSTQYADRYYPEGYEPGFDMADVDVPDKPKFQAYNRRQQNSEEAAGAANRRRQPVRNENTNRKQTVEQRRPAFAAPGDDGEASFFKSPPSGFRNENRRIGFRRPVPVEEDFSAEEDEE